jgi:DNA helicase HerA-like ATPase
MLNIADFMQTVDGFGMVNILAADKLMNSPKLYSTFLLWMLSELFETLPEVGDLDKPKLVFFFDEAHLLFADAPKALVERIELVVRLVRSKGVGVYFVTQNPLDIPRDQKAVKATAQTMRQNPGLDIEAAITELAVGEALVSFLDEKGRPSVTERAYVLPPAGQLGPITPAQRQALLDNSLVAGVYEKTVDRESAYELIKGHAPQGNPGTAATASRTAPGTAAAPAEGGGLMGGFNDLLFGSTGPRGAQRDGLVQTMAKSAVRTVGTQIGREILRGVLGGLLGGRRR